MVGGQMKKVLGNNKKEDTSNNNNNNTNTNKVSDLESKIENLQKSLRDKEHAIAELKDKNMKQEKQIDEATRAKSAKEKEATVKELKERFIQHQQQQMQPIKKDDVTRARLALPDSPVAKAVLDATLKENKDLHLRIEAMIMQAQEEKKTVQEISHMVETYKKELALAESRNQALEQELQAAKAETMRIQRQIAHLRDPLTLSHFVNTSTSTTDIPTSPRGADGSTTTTTPATTPRKGDAAAAPTQTTPSQAQATTTQATTPSQSQAQTAATTSPPKKPVIPPIITTTPEHTATTPTTSQPTTPTHTSQPSTPRQPTTPTSTQEQPVSPRPNGTTTATTPTTSNNKENKEVVATTASTAPSTTSLSPPVSPRDTLADLESYDLSKLAKELDVNSLAPSSSLSDLMDSLDSNASPMQALDFISLAQDKNKEGEGEGEGGEGGQPPSLLSPTARVEMRSPFKGESNEYDKDFISMFSPPGGPGSTQVKKVRNNPALNSLFYTEDKSSPPSFNLEGIDKDFLASNPDAELSPRSPPQSPSHFEPAHSPTSPSPSLSPSLSPSPSLSGAPPPSFAVHRSSSTSPPPPQNNHEDFPIRTKGAHKSIFSVFGNDNAASADNTQPSTNSHAQPHPSTQSQTTTGQITNNNNNINNNNINTTTNVPHHHNELLVSFGSKVDTNKAGLRRAKKVNFAAFAKGKVKVEPTMEDVHFCIYPYMKSKSRALFAVFDGHAGRAAADEAAALFPKEFNTQLEMASQDVPTAFLKTYAAVDEAMKEFEYMGTTATVVYLWQKEGHKYLQASNVGDSTAFLCRNGVSVRLTVDHKPSAPEEKERMRLAGIEVSENQTRINGLAVSRSLGNHFVKEQNIGMIAVPYVGECITIQPTDTHLIVASDGLWDVVTPQNAMDLIRGMEALPAASTLLATALSHNKCNDNVTIIVVRLN